MLGLVRETGGRLSTAWLSPMNLRREIQTHMLSPAPLRSRTTRCEPRAAPCRLLPARLRRRRRRRLPAGADDERRARAGAGPVAVERLAEPEGRVICLFALWRRASRTSCAAARLSRRRAAAAAAALRVPQQAAPARSRMVRGWRVRRAPATAPRDCRGRRRGWRFDFGGDARRRWLLRPPTAGLPPQTGLRARWRAPTSRTACRAWTPRSARPGRRRCSRCSA
jgi:hypothetical protein